MRSAESEHPMLTNREIILKISNLCSHSRYLNVTDRRKDGQTTCRSNTALCVASRGKNSPINRYSSLHLCLGPILSGVIVTIVPTTK